MQFNVFNDTLRRWTVCHLICDEYFPIAENRGTFMQQRRLAYLTSHRLVSCVQLHFELQFDYYRSTMTMVIVLDFLRKINYKKVGITSTVLVLFSIFFSMIFVPTLLKGQLKKVRRWNFLKIDFRLINICLRSKPTESRADRGNRAAKVVVQSAVRCDIQSLRFQHH